MKRSDSAMARKVDDELVVLDIPSGQYFGLNDVGALLWDLLDGTNDRDALIDAVTAEFDVDRTAAGEDIDALLDHLTTAGLVVETPSTDS
jgi:hypothetical protein